MLVIDDVNGASVSRPHRPVDGTIEICRDDALSGAVEVHDVELVILVGAAVVVIADIGDEPAVGRNRGREVRALAIGQRHRCAGNQRPLNCPPDLTAPFVEG